MQLSKNFRLSEFTRSDTAKRLGIVNECSSVEQVLNLAYLCHMVLQPLRDRFGPIRINSGYRCLELNKAVGGVANNYPDLGYVAAVRRFRQEIRDTQGLHDALIGMGYEEHHRYLTPGR